MTPECGTWQPLLSAGTHLFSCSILYVLHFVDGRRCHCCLTPLVSLRLVSRLFYDCDQGQADPVVAIARDQSSVYLQLLMHETQPPSQFTVSTITRYVRIDSLVWCHISTSL